MRRTSIMAGAFMIALMWSDPAMCQTKNTNASSGKTQAKQSKPRGVTYGTSVATPAATPRGVRTRYNQPQNSPYGNSPYGTVRKAGTAYGRTTGYGGQRTGSGIRKAGATGSVVGGRVVQPRPINNLPNSVYSSRGRARFFTNRGTSVLEGFRNRDNSIDYLNTSTGRFLYGKSNRDGSQDLLDPRTGNWIQGVKNRGGTVDYYDPRTGRWSWDTNRGSGPTPPQQ